MKQYSLNFEVKRAYKEVVDLLDNAISSITSVAMNCIANLEYKWNNYTITIWTYDALQAVINSTVFTFVIVGNDEKSNVYVVCKEQKVFPLGVIQGIMRKLTKYLKDKGFGDIPVDITECPDQDISRKSVFLG